EVGPRPSAGSRTIEPSSMGLPLKVTWPVTATLSLPQPAPTTTSQKPTIPGQCLPPYTPHLTHHRSRLTASPPLGVATACQTLERRPPPTRRTPPSRRSVLTPPLWLLRAVKMTRRVDQSG